MRAIESPSTLDDQQWLTYWVLYSFITLFELFCWKVLAWYVHITRKLFMVRDGHVTCAISLTHLHLNIYIYCVCVTGFLFGHT